MLTTRCYLLDAHQFWPNTWELAKSLRSFFCILCLSIYTASLIQDWYIACSIVTYFEPTLGRTSFGSSPISAFWLYVRKLTGTIQKVAEDRGRAQELHVAIVSLMNRSFVNLSSIWAPISLRIKLTEIIIKHRSTAVHNSQLYAEVRQPSGRGEVGVVNCRGVLLFQGRSAGVKLKYRTSPAWVWISRTIIW